MNKQNISSVLGALRGKHVFFNGKFDYGQRERLVAIAEAQQGLIASDLDASTDMVVLADLAAGKTIQKKIVSLNAKGAAIQVLDADSFKKLVEPTSGQVLELIRGGSANAATLVKAIGAGGRHFSYHGTSTPPRFTFTGEKLDGVDLTAFDFSQIAFEHCGFAGAKLSHAHFMSAKNCDFSGATAESASFGDVDGSRFTKANLKGAAFHAGLAQADFTAALLDKAIFSRFAYGGAVSQQAGAAGCLFANASMRGANMENIALQRPDFDGADLSGAILTSTNLDSASLRKAILQDATLIGCKLTRADLSGADCRRANFADADLTDARLNNADLAEVNLRGTKLGGADLSKARNYNPHAMPGGAVGPALTELDTLAQTAKRIKVSFMVRDGSSEEMEVGVDSAGLKYGWALRIPHTFMGRHFARRPGGTFSDAMMMLGNMLSGKKVRYETVDVESTKSPKGGKELREVVLTGISEAFAQSLPPAEELAAATKAYRDQTREKQTITREQREEAKKQAEKEKAKEKKKIERTIAKQVGKVTDIGSFLKALELRADKQKIDKATKMLKAERFKLFNDVADTHLAGVVKSQTDANLVYACRIESGGAYACCTQNLNICGGLRGSICKHLLVLIIGLVKAGELDPSTIDVWVAKSHDAKPELDKEQMGEIFIKYKGAEAGEVDWRPTETVPEDYYAL